MSDGNLTILKSVDELPYWVPHVVRNQIIESPYHGKPHKYGFTALPPSDKYSGGKVAAWHTQTFLKKKHTWEVPPNPFLDWENLDNLTEIVADPPVEMGGGSFASDNYFLSAEEINLKDETWETVWMIEKDYDLVDLENDKQQSDIDSFVKLSAKHEEEIYELRLASPHLTNEVRHIFSLWTDKYSFPEDLGKDPDEPYIQKTTLGELSWEVKTTKKHIDAYLVAHPQFMKMHNDPARKEFVELLKAGKSLAPGVGPQATPEEIAAAEAAELAQEEENLSIGMATHFIVPRTYNKNKKKGLLSIHLYKTPKGSKYKVGKLPKEKFTIENENPFLVVVDDEALGSKNAYSRIRILNEEGTEETREPISWGSKAPKNYDGPLYIKTKYLKKYTNTAPSLPVATQKTPIERKGSVRRHPWPLDWTELKSSGYYCYYDEEQDEYRIKMFSPSWRSGMTHNAYFKSFDDFEKNADKKKIIKKAVERIFEYYDKNDSEIETFLGSFKNAYIPSGVKGLHKNPRTKTLDVLVAVPRKYLDAVPDWQYEPDEFFGAERSVHFAWSTFSDRVKHAGTKINFFVEKLRTEFPDAAKEMDISRKEFETLPSVIEDYLFLNGIKGEDLKSKEHTIEIGFLHDFEVDYILVSYEQERAVPKMVGIEGFKLLSAPSDPGAMHYLFSMEKMMKEAKVDDMPATEFAMKYHYPIPHLKPSDTKKESEKKVEDIKEKEDKEAKSPRGKTQSELDAENRKFADTQRKIKVFQHRGRALDFTGDNIVNDLTFLAKNVKTVDDVYEHVLNKTNLEQMAQIALSAMMCSMSYDERQRLMLATLIGKAGAECIAQIIAEIKMLYPDSFKKAAKQVEKEKQEEAEKTAKPPTPPRPDNLTSSDGGENRTKVSMVADNETNPVPAGDPFVEGGGANLASNMTAEQREAAANAPVGEGVNPSGPAFAETTSGASVETASAIADGTTDNASADKEDSAEDSLTQADLDAQNQDAASQQAAGVDPNLSSVTDKMTTKDHKRILLIYANDAKGTYQISRPILQRLVLKCVPDYEVQQVINSLFKATDAVMGLIPPVPTPPTAGLSEEAATSDPEPDISKMILNGLQAALAGALISAVILILAQIKKAADEACEEEPGEMSGKINPDKFKEAFATAGIPPDLAPDFMACLTEQLSKSELQDLFNGIVSDDIRAAIKYCAAQTTPHSSDEEHISDYLDNLPRAFYNLNDIVDLDEIESDRYAPNPSQNGLLCDDDEAFADASEQDPLVQERNKRKRDMAKRIADIVDNAGGILPEIPPISSDCGEDSLLPRDMPSEALMQGKALDAIFASAKMAFSEDANAFADAMIIKELSDAQEGDPDYIKEDGVVPATGEKLNVANDDDLANAVKNKNKQNQKVRPRLAPKLRENFINEKSFVYSDAAGKQTTLMANADVIQAISTEGITDLFAAERSAVEKAENKIAKIQNYISNLGEASAGLILEKKLQAAQGELDSARTALKDAAEAASDKEVTPSVQYASKATLFYTTPWVDDSSEIKDDYSITFVNESTPINEKDSTHISYKHAPSVMLEEVDKYKFDINEGTYQSELFANYVTRPFLDNKIPLGAGGIVSDSLKDHEGYAALKEVYDVIFLDLIRKAAKQVGNSKAFDLDYFEKISFSSAAIPQQGLCPPSDGGPVDLLSLAEIKQKIQEEYDNSCKPVQPGMKRGHAFKDACRYGVIKTFVRLHMIEPLMSAVFVLTEYDAVEMVKDNLILDYILNAFEIGMQELDSQLYEDIKKDAHEMVMETAKYEQLVNYYNLNDMGLLTGKSGLIEEQQKAALKYLAMEQIEDLIGKFEKAVGSRTVNIFQRFLNPPENIDPARSAGDGEQTTPRGEPVMFPNDSKAGWIRTIDVASSQHTSVEQARFLIKEKPLIEAPSGEEAKVELGELQYPDLAHPAGTFFLERYIRVEDKSDLSIEGDHAEQVGKQIRERVGGPDNNSVPTTQVFGPKAKGYETTSAHLSGVVNINEFQSWVEDIDIDPNIKTETFFKPLKYGMRLIWVPSMTKDSFGLDKHQLRFTKYGNGKNENILNNPAWAAAGTTADFINAAMPIAFEGEQVDTAIADFISNSNKWGSKQALSEMEKSIYSYFGSYNPSSEMSDALQSEKAYILKETQVLDNYFKKSTGDSRFKVEYYSVVSRDIISIPLVAYEEEINVTNIKDFNTKDYAYDAAAFREKIMETKEFKFLFKYIFPLPRMLSLLTIYNANAVAMSIPETATAFNRTKGVLRNMYYSLSPISDNEEWWQQESSSIKELGGNQGLKQKHESRVSPGGQPNLIQMAARTVPLFIRGMAEYVDPHYRFVSKLTDAGYFPPGKTPLAIPVLWPANFPFGWGPPIGPWGLMAYSMPEMPGDKGGKLTSVAAQKNQQEDINGTANSSECE